MYIFSVAFPPLIGGAEVFVQEMSTRLAPEFEFHIITGWCNRALPRHEQHGGVAVHRVGFGMRRIDTYLFPITALLQALRLRRVAPPALVHGIMASYAGLAALVFTRLVRVPLLITEQSGNLHTDVLRRPFSFWCYRRIYRGATHIHAISSFIARAIRNNVPDAPPVSNLPNGVDLNAYLNVQPTMNRAPHAIICIARLSWEKGVDTVIRSMTTVRAHIPDARLTIVGDGPERERLESLVESLHLQPCTRFAGAIPHQDVPTQIASQSVFVCASNFEGLGNVFIEAQAGGIPVIGTNVGGIPDIVRDGVTGLLVPPRDPTALARAIIRVLNDTSLAQSFVTNARQRLPHFAWEHIASRLASQYHTLIKPRPMRTPLHLVIATGIFPPDAGGPATYSARLSNELTARGATIQIVTFGDAPIQTPNASRSIIRIPRNYPRFSRYVRYLHSLITTARASDVIYSQDPFSIGLLTLTASIWTGTPYVVKVVGDAAWEYAQNTGITRDGIDAFQHRTYSWKVHIIRLIQRRVCARSMTVVVPSHYLEGIVRGWGVRSDRIVVIPNAVDSTPVHDPFTSRSSTRRMIGIPDRTTIVSAGRLVPWKGFAALIDVMPALLRAKPSLQCYIIGDGPQEVELRRLIATNGLTEHVHLLGRQPQYKLFQLLRAADCFVLNTGYEGLPHSILEAIAMRTPIVTTTAGGNMELLTDGVDSILYTYNDLQALTHAILNVLHHPEEATQRAHRASMILSRWTWEQLSARMETLFSQFQRVCMETSCEP